MGKRDEIRAATLGRARGFRSQIVEVDGQPIEVRQPSVKVRSTIMQRGKALGGDRDRLDLGEMQVAAIIECSYVPGTNERVFTQHDRELLLDAPSGAFDELAQVAMDLMNVDREDIAKNSEPTLVAASSS